MSKNSFAAVLKGVLEVKGTKAEIITHDDGTVVIKNNTGDSVLIDPMYENFIMKKVSLEKVAEIVCHCLAGSSAPCWSDIKSRLCITVCGYDRNRDFLSDKIYKKVFDLAVVVRIFIGSKDGESIATEVMTKGFAKRLSVDAETIFKAAVENSPNVFPMKLIDTTEYFKSFGFPVQNGATMYAVTNKYMVNGAGAIFYPDVLKDLREKIQGDIFLLPSSIHEFLVIPTQPWDRSLYELKRIVIDINNSGVVEKQDVLTDNAYLYNGIAIQPV